MARNVRTSLLVVSLLTLLPALAAADNEPDLAGPIWAARHGAPLGWSGSATMVIGRVRDVDRMPCAQGIVSSVEAGSGGFKLSVGHTVGWHLAGYYPHGVAMLGTAVKATLVRTWGEPHEVGPDVTYLGGEFEIGAWFLNAGVGYLVRVGGSESSPDGLVSWSLGAGF